MNVPNRFWVDYLIHCGWQKRHSRATQNFSDWRMRERSVRDMIDECVV